MKFKTITILATLVLLSIPALSTEEISNDYRLGFADALIILEPVIAERSEIIGSTSTLIWMDTIIKELKEDEISPEEAFLGLEYLVELSLNESEKRIEAYNRNVSKPDDRIVERFGEDAAQNLSVIFMISMILPEEASSIPPTTDEPIESPLGSRENPVPLGEYSVTLSDGWKITVLDVIPDATQLVLKENMFNKPPKSGYQFFLAKVKACYAGSGSDKFEDFRLRAVGASNVAYSTFDNSCGVIPDPLPDSEVFTGGCIEGYVGWEIRSSDANSLVMYDSPVMFGITSDHVYLSLME